VTGSESRTDWPDPTKELPVVAAPDGPSPGSPATDAAVPPRRRRSPWKIALVVVAAIAVLLGGYYGVTLFQVWRQGNADEAHPVDAIVVLGAAQYDGRPSPQLQARLDHVLLLWPKGYAPTIVVTGGKQPADRFTEAATSARYLEQHGVPKSAILQETTGRNTWESLTNAANILKPLGKTKVLLVSDPYHSMRIKGIAGQLGLTAYTSPTRTSPVKGWSAFTHMLQEAGGVAIGRVIGYQHLWHGRS
jgi:uncharacterized SAM-binding protein YcdF (DUF218 family)